jgi:hypothetical protein
MSAGAPTVEHGQHMLVGTVGKVRGTEGTPGREGASIPRARATASADLSTKPMLSLSRVWDTPLARASGVG